MKKVLAVMLALVMAFTLCIPSFAENADSSQGITAIIDTVKSIVDNFVSSDVNSLDADSVSDAIGSLVDGANEDVSYENLTPEEAEKVVNDKLSTGMTKEEVKDQIEEMYATGKMDVVSYDNLLKALETAEEPTTSAPVIDSEDVATAAKQIIGALRRLGVTDDQMKSVVDTLFENEVIPQNVYDEIIKQLDSAETTTEASNAGGISGFLSGIVDTVKGLFNGGSSGDGGKGGTTTNPDSYEGKEPTCDTAIFSVAAVAAVAGVTLVLTKKKQK